MIFSATLVCNINFFCSTKSLTRWWNKHSTSNVTNYQRTHFSLAKCANRAPWSCPNLPSISLPPERSYGAQWFFDTYPLDPIRIMQFLPNHIWIILSFWGIGPTNCDLAIISITFFFEVIQICGSQTFGGISQQLSYGTIGSTSISRSRCHLWLKAVFNANIPGFRKSWDWSGKNRWETFFHSISKSMKQEHNTWSDFF